MDVRSTGAHGTVIWTLPEEASSQLADLSPQVRQQALDAFAANLSILCTSMLMAFGRPLLLGQINRLMTEMRTRAVSRG